MYTSYDAPSSRSPGSHRHQPNSLHRQPSRQFDGYGQQLPAGGLYTAEDHARGYDQQPRAFDRLNATIHSGYGYDMGASQAWNASAFSQNNPLATLGASSRMKPPARGRPAVPSVGVSPSPSILDFSLTSHSFIGLDGSTTTAA
jgi:hypothetical protein